MMMQSCFADEDCQSGQYCYKTGLCAACTNCSAYRRTKGDVPCAHDAFQCGPCIPMYAPEIFAGNKVKASCVPASTLATTASPAVDSVLLSWPLFTIPSLIFVCSILTGMYLWIKRRRIAPPLKSGFQLATSDVFKKKKTEDIVSANSGETGPEASAPLMSNNENADPSCEINPSGIGPEASAPLTGNEENTDSPYEVNLSEIGRVNYTKSGSRIPTDSTIFGTDYGNRGLINERLVTSRPFEPGESSQIGPTETMGQDPPPPYQPPPETSYRAGTSFTGRADASTTNTGPQPNFGTQQPNFSAPPTNESRGRNIPERDEDRRGDTTIIINNNFETNNFSSNQTKNLIKQNSIQLCDPGIAQCNISS